MTTNELAVRLGQKITAMLAAKVKDLHPLREEEVKELGAAAQPDIDATVLKITNSMAALTAKLVHHKAGRDELSGDVRNAVHIIREGGKS